MKKNHFVLTLPRSHFVPKGTPYSMERRATNLMFLHEEFRGWITVHAYVFKKIGGKDRIIKRTAWLENSSMVLDIQKMYFIPKKEFYKSIKQISLYKYTFEQAMENLRK